MTCEHLSFTNGEPFTKGATDRKPRDVSLPWLLSKRDILLRPVGIAQCKPAINGEHPPFQSGEPGTTLSRHHKTAHTTVAASKGMEVFSGALFHFVRSFPTLLWEHPASPNGEPYTTLAKHHKVIYTIFAAHRGCGGLLYSIFRLANVARSRIMGPSSFQEQRTMKGRWQRTTRRHVPWSRLPRIQALFSWTLFYLKQTYWR